MIYIVCVLTGYEWAKPLRHSNSSKTFTKNRKKLKHIFMNISELVESFKSMNPPDPTVTFFDGLFLEKFGTIFIQFSKFCFQSLGSISMSVWKLCVIRQRSNFGNFQQFFHHNFRLKLKIWIRMVSSERSGLYLSEYTLF